MTICQTERLILTSARPEHEAELIKLHNDPLVQKLNYRNVPQTAEAVHKWLGWLLAQWRKNGFGYWMVYEKLDGDPVFIGRCGLCDYQDTGDLEFAWVFFQDKVGRGLGPEAAHFTIAHALHNSTKEKIIGFIEQGNARAESAAKKIGLRYRGDRLYEGKLCRYYEMTRDQYLSRPRIEQDRCE
ncbi:putative Acetyltransferase including N-acetylase of ribosomal protein-like protein [Mesorhizobium sp. ORS 3359]|nr:MULTISPECIES: GNAT family N-acetyltransferase [unclassified Mesorhizobium]OHV69727.1 hypothetical protein LCM4576_22090 [Mesorhizobium sp. LCM 4576]CDX45101.1 putative Acetyltransferase including N-acetylase of ribosomal protein-like protein [Mesorhizobium sp. ORS 3359]